MNRRGDLLPNGTTGLLYVRVVDGHSAPGIQASDTVYIDELIIEGKSVADTARAAPDGLIRK